MAGHTDHEPSDAGGTPVPDLIERYRLRRDAWIAQADELARLRDEVRGSAEREAMEIVTAARKSVRQVITEARRELLVLSAQVQAALGEVNAKTDPATLLHKAGITVGDGADSHRLSLTAAADEPAFAPESAVDEILNEVNEDMTALAEDARALPLQAVPPLKPASIPPPMTAVPAPPTPHVVVPTARPYIETVAQPPVEPPARPYVEPPARPYVEPPAYTAPALSEAASQALLSSQFPSESVPVPASGRLRTFVSLFVGIGILVVLGTMWWLRNPPARGAVAGATGSKTNAVAEAPLAPAVAAPTDTPATGAPDLATAPARRANLSLMAEAIRDVWVRTTIDGQTDQGRTLAAGQVIDVTAEQRVSLRVGDAGAIVVSVNHGEKRPLGQDGQVVTREFLVEAAAAPERAPSTPAVPAQAPARAPVAPPIASTVPIPSPVAKAAPAPVQPLPAPAVPPMPTSTSASTATSPVVSPAVVTTPPVAPVRPEPAPAAPATPTSPATAVVAAARQWLDAYHRQDRAAMAALSTDNLLLADERRTDERFPPGLGDVTRTLDRVSVQIAADTAVLTAVMTEQSTSVPTPRVSPVSQVWVLAGGGQWKVRQARFVSEARLNQVFR